MKHTAGWLLVIVGVTKKHNFDTNKISFYISYMRNVETTSKGTPVLSNEPTETKRRPLQTRLVLFKFICISIY